MKLLIVSVLAAMPLFAAAQDVNLLLKEADNLEKQLKDEQALEKYKSVIAADPKNMLAFTKATELSCAIGARQTDKNAKAKYYNDALQLATQEIGFAADSASANYAMALACGKMTEVETENKKTVAYVKQIKQYADKSIAANPNFGKANYVEGKWHFEMINLSWIKKTAVKALYGGLPPAGLDSAIMYFEKCRTLEPYFAANYLDLAKAYQANREPAKALDVLNKLVKLPTRTPDDVALKAEGKKLLEEIQ
ncbi:hypothetical protein [Deminuibacter soli]|uniref:Regulator of microtubule dynamics protein 1 n=1 Tax=Deminuibacter soli TaxID=2291815 RepID=A0A3E1NGY6_9BACT|nr:hypothetical protein [Deminuibacter soli]RFM27114.1 hypothetical protein DXN05_16760 [Deminuibacter soli]